MVQRIIRDREAWVVDEATGDIIGFDHGTRTQNIVSASANSTGGTTFIVNGVPIREVPARILRLMDNPLAGLYGDHPVFAVGVGNMLYAVSSAGTNAGYSFSYDWATGQLSRSATQVCGGAITAGTVNGLWASTHGLFVSMAPSASSRRIYKASYATPNVWTEVFDFSTGLSSPEPTGDYDAKMFAECDNGYLFLAGYNSTLNPGDTYSKALLRSTNGGTTWTDIEPSLKIRADRHVHAVVWDKYRSLVWCCIGDRGDASSINVSSDYGNTWTALPSSFQATGVIPLPDSVLILSDRATVGTTETGIWKLDGDTLPELILSVPYSVFDPEMDTNLKYSAATEAGYSWWGGLSKDGVIYAAYTAAVDTPATVAALVASTDGGNTFSVIATEWGTTGASFVREEVSSPPNDYIDWDGWHWISGASTRCMPWRVHRADTALLVANQTGLANGDGSEQKPFKRIPHAVKETGRSSSDYAHQSRIWRLTENYTEQLILSTDAAIVDKNGKSFTASAAGALYVDQDFEGAGAPSGFSATVTGSATVDFDSTAQKYAGSQSARCNVTANGEYAWVQRTLPATTDGMVVAVEAMFYVDLAAMASGRLTLIKFHGNLSLRLHGATSPYLSVSTGSLNDVAGNQRSNKAFTLRKWTKLSIRTRHNYNGGSRPFSGAFEVWQDDEKILSVPGGFQTSDRASSTLVYFGVGDMSSAPAYPIPVFVDNVKVATDGSVPSQSAGFVITATGSVEI